MNKHVWIYVRAALQGGWFVQVISGRHDVLTSQRAWTIPQLRRALARAAKVRRREAALTGRPL